MAQRGAPMVPTLHRSVQRHCYVSDIAPAYHSLTNGDTPQLLRGVRDIQSGLVLLRDGPLTAATPCLREIGNGEVSPFVAVLCQDGRQPMLVVDEGGQIPLGGGVAPEDLVHYAVALFPGLEAK